MVRKIKQEKKMKTFKEFYYNILEQTEHPMIEVDGEWKHRNNSLGRPIHSTDEGIRNFHRWFGNSKTVDEHGRPQVFYHGTTSDIPRFDLNFVGHGNDALGSGFYFANKPETAQLYTDKRSDIPNAGEDANLVPVYVKVEKPIKKDEQKPLTNKQISNVITNAPEYEDSLNNFDDVDFHGVPKVLRTAVNAYRDLDKFRAMVALHTDFYNYNTPAFLTNFKKHTGHDGLIQKEGDNIVAVSFDPKHVKSVIGNSGNFSRKHDEITESRWL